MNLDYDKLTTIMYGKRVFAYDVFWVKSDGCVYMICPLFLHEIGSSFRKEASRVWYLKNHKPLLFKDGVSKLSLFFNGKKILGEVLRCADVCTLVRFSGIYSDQDDIKPILAYTVLSEEFDFDLHLCCNIRPKVSVACAAIMFNEHKCINDWLYWHSNIGADLFLLYDNDSDDVDTLRNELVGYNMVFIPWSFPVCWDTPKDWKYGYVGSDVFYFGSQGAQQTHAVYKYKESASWVSTTDIDEYIMPYPGTTLICELEKQADNTFVVIDNVLYKTSVSVGGGRIYERFVFREDVQNIVAPCRHKAIVNTSKVNFGDYVAIHIMGVAIEGAIQPRVLLDRRKSVRMNHYRGAVRKPHGFNHYDNICVMEDRIMIEISNQFKNKL